VVRVVHNNDEVSYDDDVLLQRRMRVASSGGLVTGGPPLVAITPRLDSSVAARASMPRGSGGSSSIDDVVAETRAIAEKEDADAAVAKKAVMTWRW
jgi:hypothetical protein